MKILAFEIEVGGIKSVVSDLGTLGEAIKATNTELKKGPDIGTKEYAKLQKQLGALKEIQRQENAEIRNQGREFVISADKGKRSYRAMNAELVNARMKFKELGEAERKGKIGQSIIKNIQTLDKELKEIDSSIGQFQRNVGNYKQALIGLGDIVTGGLITGGLQELFRDVTQFGKEAVLVTADFNRQIGILGQVSGAALVTVQVEGRGAVNALTLLEEKALELGGTTEFSASQVADLEIAYAKLGFKPVEILALLSDTIDTATVSGSELGRTAEVIGTTLRAFQLPAEEGARVADVMAKAFASSSLDLSKFETALGVVGASGNAVGFTLEEVTALLSVLTDAGFDASTAATSLRNIFIENATEGLTLDQALNQLVDSTNALVDADTAYGKRGAVQAVVLSNQINRTEELTTTLQKAAGFSRESAKVIRDDLQGAMDNVTSATETLQITLIDTFGDTLKNGFNNLAQFLTNITGLVNGTGEWAERLDDVQALIKNLIPGLLTLAGVIASANAQIIFQALTALPAQIAALKRSTVAVNIFKAANVALNFVLKLNRIGLIVSTLILLGGALVTAYQRSEKFRAVIAGLGAVATEVFTIIKEAVGSFAEGFNQISEGNISAGLKSFGEGIKKANPIGIAFGEGQRLKDAFNKGASELLIKEEEERRLQEAMKEVGDEGAKAAETAGEQVGGALGGSLDKSIGQTLDKLKARKKELTKELGTLEIGSEQFEEVSEELNSVNAKIKELTANIKGADVPGAFQQLTGRLNELKTQIQDNIAAGESYADLLEEYITLSKSAADAQEEFKTRVEAVVAASLLAEGSVGMLSAEVSRLKEQLSTAAPGNIQEITNELVLAEKKLQDAQNAVERSRLIASAGVSTGLLPDDIQSDIDTIEQVKEARIAALNDVFTNEEDFNSKREQIAVETDIQILEKRLELYRIGTKERLELENRLAEKRRQLANIEVSSNLDAEISDIEAARDQRILALERVKNEEKRYQTEREAIERESTVEILKTRLELDQLNQQERLALQIELADAEVSLEESKNQRILESRRVLNEQTVANFQFVAQSLNTAIQALGQTQDAATQRRVNDITQFYEKQIELAEGNDEQIRALEEERDAAVRELQEEQFERQKRLQIAQALISGAQAIVSTLAAVPGPVDILSLGAIRALQVGLVAATTAAQVAAIASQSFAKGGFTGPGRGRPDSSGHRPVGIAHEHEYIMPKKVLFTKQGNALADAAEKLRVGKRIDSRFINEMGLTGSLATIMPEVPRTSGSVNVTASINEDSMAALIGRISDTLKDEVKQGVIEGMKNRDRMDERKNTMKKNSRI